VLSGTLHRDVPTDRKAVRRVICQAIGGSVDRRDRPGLRPEGEYADLQLDTARGSNRDNIWPPEPATLAATDTAVGTTPSSYGQRPFGGTASATLSVNVITGTPPRGQRHLRLGYWHRYTSVGENVALLRPLCDGRRGPCRTDPQSRPPDNHRGSAARPAYYTCLQCRGRRKSSGVAIARVRRFRRDVNREDAAWNVSPGAVQTANGVAPPCTGSCPVQWASRQWLRSINNLMLGPLCRLVARTRTTPLTLFVLGDAERECCGHIAASKVWSSSLRLAKKLHAHRPVVRPPPRPALTRWTCAARPSSRLTRCRISSECAR